MFTSQSLAGLGAKILTDEKFLKEVRNSGSEV
jgi:hypothetical protein